MSKPRVKLSQRVAPTSGTQILPEYQALLDDLGINYWTFRRWRKLGYLPSANWYHYKSNPELIQRAKDLAEATRLHAMTLGELADHLAKERKAHEPV